MADIVGSCQRDMELVANLRADIEEDRQRLVIRLGSLEDQVIQLSLSLSLSSPPYKFKMI